MRTIEDITAKWREVHEAVHVANRAQARYRHEVARLELAPEGHSTERVQRAHEQMLKARLHSDRLFIEWDDWMGIDPDCDDCSRSISDERRPGDWYGLSKQQQQQHVRNHASDDPRDSDKSRRDIRP